MSSMGSFEGELLRASMAYNGYFIDALSCTQEDKDLGGATEKCPECPRSKAVEAPSDDYGRSQDTSDTRERERCYGPRPSVNPR